MSSRSSFIKDKVGRNTKLVTRCCLMSKLKVYEITFLLATWWCEILSSSHIFFVLPVRQSLFMFSLTSSIPFSFQSFLSPLSFPSLSFPFLFTPFLPFYDPVSWYDGNCGMSSNTNTAGLRPSSRVEGCQHSTSNQVPGNYTVMPTPSHEGAWVGNTQK